MFLRTTSTTPSSPKAPHEFVPNTLPPNPTHPLPPPQTANTPIHPTNPLSIPSKSQHHPMLFPKPCTRRKKEILPHPRPYQISPPLSENAKPPSGNPRSKTPISSVGCNPPLRRRKKNPIAPKCLRFRARSKMNWAYQTFAFLFIWQGHMETLKTRTNLFASNLARVLKDLKPARSLARFTMRLPPAKKTSRPCTSASVKFSKASGECQEREPRPNRHGAPRGSQVDVGGGGGGG